MTPLGFPFDWVLPVRGRPSRWRLHWVTGIDDPDDRERLELGDGPVDARLGCGRDVGPVAAPGVLSRLGAVRCAACCRAAGVKRGVGNPANGR